MRLAFAKLSFVLNPYLRIYLLILEREEVGRERRRKRERNIHVRDKYLLAASHMCPKWESNLQLRYVFWPGIKPQPWSMGWHCNQLSHLVRAWQIVLRNASCHLSCLPSMFVVSYSQFQLPEFPSSLNCQWQSLLIIDINTFKAFR